MSATPTEAALAALAQAQAPSDEALPREAVVLLHASGSSAKQWNGLADRLGARYAVHAPDFHGHGTRPGWAGSRPLTLADEAALVAATLRECGPAHLVGHSYGAAVALKVAQMLPQAVRSLVVFEPPLFAWLFADDPRGPAAREVEEVSTAMGERLARGDRADAARRFVDYWSGEGAWDRLSGAARERTAERISAVHAHFHALRQETYAGLPARPGYPVCYLGGTRSPASVRRVAQIARRRMPFAAFEVLPGVGHMGPVTHGPVVLPRIEAALDCVSHPLFRISSLRASGGVGPSLVWRHVERARRAQVA